MNTETLPKYMVGDNLVAHSYVKGAWDDLRVEHIYGWDADYNVWRYGITFLSGPRKGGGFIAHESELFRFDYNEEGQIQSVIQD